MTREFVPGEDNIARVGLLARCMPATSYSQHMSLEPRGCTVDNCMQDRLDLKAQLTAH